MAARAIFCQAQDTNGDIISGALLHVEEAGTNTDRAIFTDAALSTASTNPAVADSTGSIRVFINDANGNYKVRLTSSDGATTYFSEDGIDPTKGNLLVYPLTGDQGVGVAATPTFAGLTLSGNLDLDGNRLTLDADADTYIEASTDDRFDVVVGGVLRLRIDPNTADVFSFDGVSFSPTGATVGQALGYPNAADTLEPYTPAGGGDALLAADENVTGDWQFNQFPQNARYHGATGNGTTDDTTAIEAAQTADDGYEGVFLPSGIYDTTIASTALTSRFFGSGRLRDASNNLRAPFFSAISSAPSEGDGDSLETAFNGDLSKVPFAIEHRVTGSATIGQPSTGYKFTEEAVPFYTFLYNEAGHNEETDSNVGRTGLPAFRTQIFQNGQGDLMCYHGTAFVTGTKAGSTDYLANPAAVLYGGDMTAGADGVYFNPREIIMRDAGYDVAAIGDVINFVRTDDAGAKNVWWCGYRPQNQTTNSTPIDVFYSMSGLANFGVDFSHGDFSGNSQAAATLKADQRIYFNVTPEGGQGRYPTALNSDFVYYNSSTSSIDTVIGGNTSHSVTSGGVNTTGNVAQSRADGSPTISDISASSSTGNPYVLSRAYTYAPNDWQNNFDERHRARGTEGTPAAVQSGDALWTQTAFGRGSSDWGRAVQMRTSVSGAPSGNFIGGQWTLSVGDGSTYAADSGSAIVITVTPDKKTSFSGDVNIASGSALQINGVDAISGVGAAIADPNAITAYTAPDISATYTEAEVQAIADAHETLRNEVEDLRAKLQLVIDRGRAKTPSIAT